MSDLSSTAAETIVTTCTENAAAIAESLNQCFDVEHTLSLGEPAEFAADDVPEGLGGPGLLVSCRVGDEALLCAISATLPIPEWYTNPGDSERARLETLAMEWSLNLLPPDLECTEFSSTACGNLWEAVSKQEPADAATMVPVIVDGGEPRLWIVWPVTAPATAATAEEVAPATAEESAPPASPPPQPTPAAAAPANAPPTAAHAPDPLSRIRSLQVPVIVKLAERRIEIEELLRLGPGAIVTFDKSCEELLDLMVNDRIYARGEAVKIGEKFGIKISEVGYVPKREPRVLS